jgi:hypothetical protein
LGVESKTAHFELDRASIENSLRAILARFAAPEVVNRTLDSVQAALGSNTRLSLTEPLLLIVTAQRLRKFETGRTHEGLQKLYTIRSASAVCQQYSRSSNAINS